MRGKFGSPSEAHRLSKGANMLLTRIRVGNSFLKAHSFSKDHSETSICSYCRDNKTENSKHFVIILQYSIVASFLYNNVNSLHVQSNPGIHPQYKHSLTTTVIQPSRPLVLILLRLLFLPNYSTIKKKKMVFYSSTLFSTPYISPPFIIIFFFYFSSSIHFFSFLN